MSPGSRRERVATSAYGSGGGGHNFEVKVQACFAVLMLVDGFVPCFQSWKIVGMNFQSRGIGIQTDDVTLELEKPGFSEKQKLICQIKHGVKFTASDSRFADAISNAWVDFNNADHFTKGKDAIAIITGPLSKTDTDDIRYPLEVARHIRNAANYFEQINAGIAFSAAKKAKLGMLRSHLNGANSNVELTDEEFHSFLRHFHLLGYDLDVKQGVCLSFLTSLISGASTDPHGLWLRIADEVRSFNENGGELTKPELLELLEIPEIRVSKLLLNKPKSLAVKPLSRIEVSRYADAFCVLNLVGSWNEKRKADKELVSNVAEVACPDFLVKLQELGSDSNSGVLLSNGIWKVTRRPDLFREYAKHLYDNHLEVFAASAMQVLKQQDPKCGEDRIQLAIEGPGTYSSKLRVGIAETLVLLERYSSSLTNCTLGFPHSISRKVVCSALENGNAGSWASLDDVMPLLADAAPENFLQILDIKLSSPVLFAELFSYESNDVFGRNYLTGTLWALESLAREPEFINGAVHSLAELAAIDPGGKWGNRPISSLVRIFLPWYPQTQASFTERKTAFKNIALNLPNIAWNLVLQLLPSEHQSSFENYKRLWTEVSQFDPAHPISRADYQAEIDWYAMTAVDLAKSDVSKLTDLLSILNNLPNEAILAIIPKIDAEFVSALDEPTRLKLWTMADSLHSEYKNSSELSESERTFRDSLYQLTLELAPTDVITLCINLFSWSKSPLFTDREGTWEDRLTRQGIAQLKAVRLLLQAGGVKAVKKLAELVESPEQVGGRLSAVDEFLVDEELLPELLDSKVKHESSFVRSFVNGKFERFGALWLEKLPIKSWTIEQIGTFLAFLPCNQITWDLVKKYLGRSSRKYWEKVWPTGLEFGGDPNYVADQLTLHKRPEVAARVLSHAAMQSTQLNTTTIQNVLMKCAEANENAFAFAQDSILDLIKLLQQKEDISEDDICEIELIYLELLSPHAGTTPTRLGKRMATNPQFFSEVVKLAIKSEAQILEKREPSSEQMKRARGAFQLLFDWETPPGLMTDGAFNGKKATDWLQEVEQECLDSNHREIARTYFGKTLFHAPRPSSGLWIDPEVAKVLDRRDFEDIRRGFAQEYSNDRGVHWVDHTGAEEDKLAAECFDRATALNEAGFVRFAQTLRLIGNQYRSDGESLRKNSSL